MFLHFFSAKQEDFSCHPSAFQAYSSLAPNTYVDLVAKNSEPCACWFRSSGTIQAKVLTQGRYECFREFHHYAPVPGKDDEGEDGGLPRLYYHACTPPLQEEVAKHYGDELGGDRLLATISEDVVSFLDNSTHYGIVNSPLNVTFSRGRIGYSLSSLRVQGKEMRTAEQLMNSQ